MLMIVYCLSMCNTLVPVKKEIGQDSARQSCAVIKTCVISCSTFSLAVSSTFALCKVVSFQLRFQHLGYLISVKIVLIVDEVSVCM
jgi:hypothetical protein